MSNKRFWIFGALIALLFIIAGQIFAQQGQLIDRYNLSPMHWVRFRARGVFDRSLIYSPVWNIGNFADSDLSPGEKLRWPGSEGLNYGDYFCFYIGALVQDMSMYKGKKVPPQSEWTGKEFPIVSDSYFRIYGPSSNAQMSSDRTHQCVWSPRPGYFNDGYGGWVNGVDEDANHNEKLDAGEDLNFNGILDHHLEPPERLIKSMAMSTDIRTWPEYWPAGSYIGDDRPPKSRKPGKRAGIWNGEYGEKTIADQESYYVMDDHENDWWNGWKTEKYWPMKNDDGTPDTTPWIKDGIAGAGIEVEGRGYTWFHPLAEDILVNLYRVRNYSDYVLQHVVTGIYADADIVQSSYNQVDYIVATYDYTGEGGRTDFDIMYQWHKFPEQLGTKKKVGVFGFAFLESPGIDYNGLDDDFDHLTDESMHNNIDDDGDWKPFDDFGLDRIGPDDPDYKKADIGEGNGVWDTEDTNHNGALDKGEDINHNDHLDFEPVNDDVGTDGVGPQDNEYRGPDPDGSEADGLMEHGEPNFDETDIDEADQAGLKHVYAYEVNNDLLNDKRYWEKYLRREDERIEETDDDLCFTFGAREVKLEKMNYKRFAIAAIMGQDNEDVVRNKSIMQRIYNANYHFLTPPVQPTLITVASDKKVQLYWDTDAENSKDPFFGNDFEGYRVYKSTDPDFYDQKTITDAFGNVLLFKPIAIYDKIDGLKGPHPVPFPSLGVHYNMGTDSGLRHSYKDTLVDNGRKYFYAVSSIDTGNDFDFYERGLVTLKHPLQAMPSESPFNITVNRLGEVVFRDRNTGVAIPTQMAAGYVNPHVDTLQLKHISGFARGGRHNIEVFNRDHVNVGSEYEMTFTDDHWLDDLDSTMHHGLITGIKLKNLTTDSVLFDLHDSTHQAFMNNIPPVLERTLYEGLHFDLTWPVPRRSDWWNSDHDWEHRGTELIKWDERGRKTREWQKWAKGDANLFAYTLQIRQDGYALPYDFEIRVGEMGDDTSRTVKYTPQGRIDEVIPLNFSTWNVSDPYNEKKMRVKVYYDLSKESADKVPDMKGQIWDSTRIVILFGPHQKDGKTAYYSSWEIRFNKDIHDSLNPVIPPKKGDVYRFRTIRNPDRTDVYRFKIDGGVFTKERAKKRMKEIYVVPDPYVAFSGLESMYYLGGRASRKIEFVNLPPQCSIKIFTTSGKLVRELHHNSLVDYGRQSWDMTTEDGPEIAFGVYFYVVEAKDIGTFKGKFAVIK